MSISASICHIHYHCHQMDVINCCDLGQCLVLVQVMDLLVYSAETAMNAGSVIGQ